MSPIVTRELVRRYLIATGRHDAGLFERLINNYPVDRTIGVMGIDRAVLGMLAAAESLFEEARKTDAMNDDGDEALMRLAGEDRTQAQRLLGMVGVSAEAWEKARQP